VKLRLVHIEDEGQHKVLVLDENKTTEEGKLVAWTVADTKDEAMAEAEDMKKSIIRSGGKLVWH
jgi:hypothetical protein